MSYLEKLMKNYKKPDFLVGSKLIRESDLKEFEVVSSKKIKEFGKEVTEYRLKAPSGLIFPTDYHHLEMNYKRKR